MPAFRAMKPAPKIGITRFGAGVHSFWKAEKDLPAAELQPAMSGLLFQSFAISLDGYGAGPNQKGIKGDGGIRL